jgi:antitoxin HicB
MISSGRKASLKRRKPRPIKEVVAWQLAQAMKKKKISKSRMAVLLKTSRTQVDRLLDPKNDITLSSLQRAAAMVGRRVSIELV